MAISCEERKEGNSVVIHVNGQFDFSVVQEFRSAYQDCQGKDIVVDFRGTEYIDSAGLGMLLNMQTFLEQKDGDIRLINTMPQIKRVLVIARFEKKFKIE
ncbi:anti-anti-sigma factor [Enterovibrio norvegicus]|uniref:Anti-sigma factor antagonist n=1 Tax=Enterovibrio norvegicus DSM 15893 TaxID=1121869 RepID=A0A1I5XKS3_9GAMM|nr:STAS domain-containing protein [Enterovibrio norvegicus]OEF52542.1 anti-anti-sigma factor [Enterovibrio norvegicus]SFQ32582.1 anti-anti-sigma factor [Enterovibrio norvegicus DSM 15893]